MKRFGLAGLIMAAAMFVGGCAGEAPTGVTTGVASAALEEALPSITASVDRLPADSTADIPIVPCDGEAVGQPFKDWIQASTGTTSRRQVTLVQEIGLQQTHPSMHLSRLTIPLPANGTPLMVLQATDDAPVTAKDATNVTVKLATEAALDPLGVLSNGTPENVCAKKQPPPPPPPPKEKDVITIESWSLGATRVDALVIDLDTDGGRVSDVALLFEGEDALQVARLTSTAASFSDAFIKLWHPSGREAGSVHVSEIVVTKMEETPATRETGATLTLHLGGVASIELL